MPRDKGKQAQASRCAVCGAVNPDAPAVSTLEGSDYLCPDCEAGGLAPSILLNALSRLNQISSTINQLSPGDSLNVEATLRLIVESAIEVVPGASSVIYTYDQSRDSFDPQSRLAAGETTSSAAYDMPRPNGMGRRALTLRRRILSYEEDDLEIHDVKVEAGAKAVVCFPLQVSERIVGVLYVYLHETRKFSQLELLMLDNFVNQAAMAIHHTRKVTRAHQNLSRKEEELGQLRRAGLLISSRHRLEETLEAIIQMALRMTNAQYGVFRLVNRTGTQLSIAAIAGKELTQPLAETLTIDTSSITGWVATHRQPLLVTDLREKPWADIYRPLDPELEMRSELAAPLIGASGRLEGILNLESPQVAAFSEQDSHLLQSLATQAVIAIQEIRLLDALQEVARRLLTEPHRGFLEYLAEAACTLLNAAASSIWLLDGETLSLEVASRGHKHGESVPLHDSLIGKAILERAPIASNDVKTDPLFHRPDLARAQGWTRALIVPLVASAEQEPVGAFSVYSVDPAPGRFAESEWDKKVLTALGHYAVLAVQNDARQRALRTAEERQTVSETFAVLGDIAANLLHELNNKVGIIPVRVQGILDKSQPALDGDPYLMANLTEIERSATEAMAVVRENLSLLRPISLVPVDVAACIQDAVAAIDLPEDIRVEVDTPPTLPRVLAAAQSLRLVFSNLLENAAKAMDYHGLIKLEARPDENWVEVAIHDTGPGIAPELRGRIFDFSFSGHTLARASKLGFGLWWVKTLMTRLGGTVSVESEIHHGTTFRLRIPQMEQRSPHSEADDG